MSRLSYDDIGLLVMLLKEVDMHVHHPQGHLDAQHLGFADVVVVTVVMMASY